MVTVVAQAVANGVDVQGSSFTTTATCTEVFGGDKVWEVVLSANDLRNVQGANTSVEFRASITDDHWVTGTATPQTLFVEPDTE